MNYLERLRDGSPVLYWIVLIVGFWLGFRLLLAVAQLLLGSFALPAWAPLALVIGALVLVARRQQRSR